ncbi:MAG: YdcF family protein [Myxococcota bacterium]
MISRLLDPVFFGLVILLAGLIGWTMVEPRRALLRWKALAWSGFLVLWLCASPWFTNTLVRWVQPRPPDLSTLLEDTEPAKRAMVILAGGLRNELDFVPPPEQLGDATQARLLGGARIYRDLGGFGTVIVTGTGDGFVKAMADYLVLQGIPRERIVRETQATDTETNATYSAAILAKRAPDKVVLVTSALHMPRSVAEFEDAGVEVIPAPVDYANGQGMRLVPSSSTLHRSSRVLHELLGRLEP